MYSYRLTVIFFIALCSIISLLLLLLKSLLRPNCLSGCDLFFSPVFFKIFWSLVFWSFTTISFSYIFNSLLSSGSFQTIYEHVFLSFILKNKTKENLLLTLSPHQQPNFLSPNASKLSKICLYFLSKISLAFFSFFFCLPCLSLWWGGDSGVGEESSSGFHTSCRTFCPLHGSVPLICHLIKTLKQEGERRLSCSKREWKTIPLHSPWRKAPVAGPKTVLGYPSCDGALEPSQNPDFVECTTLGT